MAYFKNVYENNHVPGICKFKNALVEDRVNGKFYFYDSAGTYSAIDESSRDLDNIQEQIDSINERLDNIGAPDVDATDVFSWMRNDFLPTVNQSSSDLPLQSYRVIQEDEYVDVITGLRLIAQNQGRKYNDIDIADAAGILNGYGFTVEKGIDSANYKPYVLVYNENTKGTGNNRAWGMYYFNMAAPMSIVISNPHPQSDEFAENPALWHAQEQDGAFFALSGVYRNAVDTMKKTIGTYGLSTSGTFSLSFRGQTTNPMPYDVQSEVIESELGALSTIGTENVRTYQDADDDDPLTSITRTIIELDPSLYNPASPNDRIIVNDIDLDNGIFDENWVDEARNRNSCFHRVVVEFATQGLLTIQYHGFSDLRPGTNIPRAANVVLSDSRSSRSKVFYAIKESLERKGIDLFTRFNYDVQGITFTGSPSFGTFTLTYDGETTAPITYSTNEVILRNNIQDALESLSNIGQDNIKVTISTNNNAGNPTFVIKFVRHMYEQASGPRIAAMSSLNQGVITTLNGSNVGLAAITNSQAADISEAGLTFIHIEIGATYRNNPMLLRSVYDAIANIGLPQLSAASYPALATPADVPSNAPLSVVRSATTGSSPRAARADHRHAWSSSDDVAGNNYIASRNNNNTGNVWRTPTQVRSVVGMGSEWVPEHYNLQAWTGDPATTSDTFQIANVGELQTVQVRIPSEVVTGIFQNIHIHCTGTLVGSEAHFGIYEDGDLVAQTGDVSSQLGSLGYKTFALTTPAELGQGIIEVAFFVGAASQLPAFRSHATSAIINGPFFTSGSRWATADIGLTDSLPVTLGAKNAVATGYWVGLS